MTTFKTLVVGAAIGALLAVTGVAATMAALKTSAGDVATKMADKSTGNSGADPLEPPNFYGSR